MRRRRNLPERARPLDWGRGEGRRKEGLRVVGVGGDGGDFRRERPGGEEGCQTIYDWAEGRGGVGGEGKGMGGVVELTYPSLPPPLFYHQ